MRTLLLWLLLLGVWVGPGLPSAPAAPAHPPSPWYLCHQAKDGSWPAASYPTFCRMGEMCVAQGAASDTDTPATTALTLMMLTAYGTGLKQGMLPEQFTKGVDYLVAQQDESGRIGPEHADGRHRYNTVLALLALAEAYVAGGRPSALGTVCQRALDYHCAAQRPDGAWPLGSDPEQGDAALTVWTAIAFKSAALAWLTIPEGSVERALAWLEGVRGEDGAVGWRTTGDTGAPPHGCRWMGSSNALRAAVAAARILHRRGPDDPSLAAMTTWLPAHPPTAEKPDAAYAYFGTLTAFQMGGEVWQRWATALEDAVVRRVRVEHGACITGSWDPTNDPYGADGGLIYTSTLNAIAAAIYQRHPPAAAQPK